MSVEMESIDKFWRDRVSGNKWSKGRYTEVQAAKHAASMVCCRDCIDCTNCGNCTGCKDCDDCNGCGNCLDCTGCRYSCGCVTCKHCEYCKRCVGCDSCHRCRGCTECSRCEDCNVCDKCTGCERCQACTSCASTYTSHQCGDCHDTNNLNGCKSLSGTVSRYVHHAIGSRGGVPVMYWRDQYTHCVVGCFTGTLQELKQRVMETYPSTRSKHRKEYEDFIAKAEAIIAVPEKQNKSNVITIEKRSSDLICCTFKGRGSLSAATKVSPGSVRAAKPGNKARSKGKHNADNKR